MNDSAKKMKRTIRTLITAIMLISAFQSMVFASSAEDRISSSIGLIVNAIAWAGYVIAFGMLLFVGAKYALSAANERADVKRGAVGYVIGAILIAGASTIAAAFVGIASGGIDDRETLADKIIDVGQNATK